MASFTNFTLTQKISKPYMYLYVQSWFKQYWYYLIPEKIHPTLTSDKMIDTIEIMTVNSLEMTTWSTNRGIKGQFHYFGHYFVPRNSQKCILGVWSSFVTGYVTTEFVFTINKLRENKHIINALLTTDICIFILRIEYSNNIIAQRNHILACDFFIKCCSVL